MLAGAEGRALGMLLRGAAEFVGPALFVAAPTGVLAGQPTVGVGSVGHSGLAAQRGQALVGLLELMLGGVDELGDAGDGLGGG